MLGTMQLVCLARMVPDVGFIFGLWLLISIGARYSGAHYNPAVTLAFMTRRNPGDFKRLMGFAYFLAEFIGGSLGGLAAWYLNDDPGALYVPDNRTLHQAFFAEAVGTCFFVFIILC